VQNAELNSDTLIDTAGNSAVGGTSAGAAAGGVSTAGSVAMPTAGMTSAGGNAMAGSAGQAVMAGSGGMAQGGGGAGGAGGMSGIAGGGGAAGSGGGGSNGFRYVKLVATSEQSGAVWSSCAELRVQTTGGAEITRGQWVASADSEELDDELAPAAAVIDGDQATFWHTSWEPAPDNVNDPQLPHSLVVDMGSASPITGFSYLPRQTGSHGRIKDWQFYVSKNGVDWGTAVKTGTFPDGVALQTVSF
jgi:hypothetical protein